MIQIISDTSTLYSTAQAREAGFTVSPLSVTIAGKSYREFDEISAEEFVDIINQGHMPTSSQPAVGEVAEVYDSFPGCELLNIAMAEGLSGTYNGAVAAAAASEEPERITVWNSRTLCGPHRHLVEKALELAKQELSAAEIVEKLESLMTDCRSYLMPADFAYLRRGGRLSPLVSYVGQAVQFAPVLTQTEDGRQLTMAGVRRSFKHAIQYLAKDMATKGVGEGWNVYISHAAVPAKAQQAQEILQSALPGAKFEILPLSPAFITQGGPGCVAVQYIRSEV